MHTLDGSEFQSLQENMLLKLLQDDIRLPARNKVKINPSSLTCNFPDILTDHIQPINQPTVLVRLTQLESKKEPLGL